VAPPPVPHSANISAQPTYFSRHQSEPNNDFTEFDDMATWDDSIVDKIKTFTNHPKDNFKQMKAPKQVDQNDNRQHQPVAIHNSSACSSAERTVSLSLQVVVDSFHLSLLPTQVKASDNRSQVEGRLLRFQQILSKLKTDFTAVNDGILEAVDADDDELKNKLKTKR